MDQLPRIEVSARETATLERFLFSRHLSWDDGAEPLIYRFSVQFATLMDAAA